MDLAAIEKLGITVFVTAGVFALLGYTVKFLLTVFSKNIQDNTTALMQLNHDMRIAASHQRTEHERIIELINHALTGKQSS